MPDAFILLRKVIERSQQASRPQPACIFRPSQKGPRLTAKGLLVHHIEHSTYHQLTESDLWEAQNTSQADGMCKDQLTDEDSLGNNERPLIARRSKQTSYQESQDQRMGGVRRFTMNGLGSSAIQS